MKKKLLTIHCSNMKGNKYILLLAIMLLFSCDSKQGGSGSKSSETSAFVNVDLSDYIDGGEDNKIVMSELVDSLGYIPLQTPDELPVDILIAVKMSPSYIFLLDRQQNLFRFDKQGCFLNLVGRRGEGPQGYINAISFDVDEDNDVVYVFDIHRKRIVSYGMAGDYIGNINIPDGVESASLLNDSSFIGYKPWYATKDKKEECVVFGKKAEISDVLCLEGFEGSDGLQVDLIRMPNFSNIYDTSLFSMPFDNIIYRISDDNKVCKEVAFDLGKYLLPVEYAVNNELYNQHLNDAYIFELNSGIGKGHVYLNFFFKMEHYRVVYDMAKQKFYTVFKGRYPQGIVNDMDGGASFWPLWFTHTGMIGVIMPEDLEAEDMDNDVKKLYEKFKEYDNPVLQVGYY